MTPSYRPQNADFEPVNTRWTGFTRAAGDNDQIDDFLETGQTVNARNEAGFTALDLAIENGNNGAIEELVSAAH